MSLPYIRTLTWTELGTELTPSPGEPKPDAATMNYAVVVSAAVWIFAGGYYFMPKIGGKTFFTYVHWR